MNFDGTIRDVEWSDSGMRRSAGGCRLLVSDSKAPESRRSPDSRGRIAFERAQIARAMLADCHFCEHHCGVNRLAGELGLCRAGADVRFFSAQTEVSDELELIPTFAVALSGCDLRCDFCITGRTSWNPREGMGFDAGTMAARAVRALEKGARTIMILGGEPTIHLHAALEFVAAMPDSAKLVWKTNAHGSAQSCELLDGIFDVWLADFKFGNDDCAQRLARVSDYVRIVEENLLRVAQGPASRSKDSPINTGLQPGDSESRATSAASAALSANGKPLKRLESLRSVCTGLKRGVNERERHASEVSDLLRGTQLTKSSDPLRRTELIVRHLLMPGHVDCCWRPVAHWLAAELAGVKVNLRSGFWPAWHSARHPELRGTVAHDESERALAMAHELGLNLIP